MTDFTNVMEQMNDPKNWKKTHKKGYDIYVCRPLPGTECVNRLEGVHYVTDEKRQFILSGTMGETWTTSFDNMAKTYTFPDGSPITPEVLKQKCQDDGQIEWLKIHAIPGAELMWAFFLPKNIANFPVQTSWGDTLYANRYGVEHGFGDFILCKDMGGMPDTSHARVINGVVFPKTYDLHAFPNMFSKEVIEAETLHPIQKFNKKNPIRTKSDKQTIEIVNGLKRLGHRIGVVRDNEIVRNSFKIDGGAYGVIVDANDERGTFISVFGHVDGSFQEVLGFFLEDIGMDATIQKIHNVASGSKKSNNLKERAYNESKGSPDSILVMGQEVDMYGNNKYQADVDFAVKVINNTLGKRGYLVESSGYPADINNPEEMFRVTARQSNRTVVCVNGTLILYDDSLENELDKIKLPDKADKNSWKSAIQWIARSLY